MNEKGQFTLLVGDNPFHGISHLSQERSRARDQAISDVENAAGLVATSLDNGADGFMFSVSETTLAILARLGERVGSKKPRLYAIVPYAYEYVRLATEVGMQGLARKFAKQIMFSRDVKNLLRGLKGVLYADLAALLETYVKFEVSRIRSASRKKMILDSVFIHEVLTEMALAMKLERLFKSYIEFMKRSGITPGFETRNFAYLVRRFKEWDIDFADVTIATPLNRVGFQMNPSRSECEKALAEIPTPNVIAMSTMAAGYLRLPEAISYIQTLPNLRGLVAGVSKEQHARETFKLLRESFK
jgi:hypothetical protein